MASALTANEQTTYRSPRQATRVSFAIPEYHTIYTAELDSVPSTNDQVGEITFVNGVGTLSDVKADMTLYAGTSAGAYDLGMCRIRKAPIAGTFYIGEISEIDFNAGGTVYLSVVDDYSLWAKPVRLVSGVAKMDYDIDYSDQHTDFDPAPILGSHAVGKLEDGTVTIQLGPSDDTASYAIGSSISSVLWSGSGVSFDNAASVNPNATFTAVGTYILYCLITAANGKTFQGVRYVIIYDDDNPLFSGVLKNWNYDHDSGGLSFGVQMYANADEATIRKRSLVIVVTEDTIDNQPIDLPCPIEGRENILSVGWIGPENITFHEAAGMVEFTCHNATNWFKSMEGYLSGVEFKVGASDDWTNCSTLTVRKMLFHFLHWRTTATRVMDVVLTDDTRYAVGFKTVTGGLWEQINTISDLSIFAKPGVDRFNRLFIEVEPQMVPEADRASFPEIMTLDSQDWVGQVQVLEELPRISMLYFSGIAVDASANPLAYVSLSPGHIHGRYGATTPKDNYLVDDQDDSNQLCGLFYGWQNNLKEFEIEMAHSHRMMDIWPRQYVNLDIDTTEDPRGIGYSGRAILRRVEGKHDPGKGVLSFAHYYEPETFEGLAINGDIPDSATDDLGAIPKFPPLKPIPLTPLTLPVLPGDTPTDAAPKYVLLNSSNFGFKFTQNGNEASPTWQFMNAGLTATLYGYVDRVIKTPSGALFALIRDSADANGVGGSYIYWSPGLGSEWSLLKDLTGLAGTSPRLVAIGYNPDAEEEIAVLAGHNNPAEGMLGTFWTGDRNGVTQLVGGIDAKTFIGDITYGLGKWMLSHCENDIFSSQAWSRITAAGALEVNSYNFGSGDTASASAQFQRRGGGNVYWWNDHGAYLRSFEDNLAGPSDTTMPNVGTTEKAPQNLISVDPTGQYLMGGHSGVIGKRSTDYGVTWGNVDATLGIGYQVWECAGNALRFLAATTQVLKWTDDFGDTWYDMSGNLATLAPLCTIKHVLYIGD